MSRHVSFLLPFFLVPVGRLNGLAASYLVDRLRDHPIFDTSSPNVAGL